MFFFFILYTFFYNTGVSTIVPYKMSTKNLRLEGFKKCLVDFRALYQCIYS